MQQAMGCMALHQAEKVGRNYKLDTGIIIIIIIFYEGGVVTSNQIMHAQSSKIKPVVHIH